MFPTSVIIFSDSRATVHIYGRQDNELRPVNRTGIIGVSMSLICLFSGSGLSKPLVASSNTGQVKWFFNNFSSYILIYDRKADGTPSRSDPSTFPENARYKFSRNFQIEDASDLEETSSVLQIHDFSIADQGNYTCQVSNKHGEMEVIVYVRAMGRIAAFSY